MEHTKEPWAICEIPPNRYWHKGTTIFSIPTGRRAADVEPLVAEHQANAERIVAAVNATHGIPTTSLEEGVIEEMKEVLCEIHNTEDELTIHSMGIIETVLAKLKKEGL